MIIRVLEHELESASSYQDIMTIMKLEYSRLNITEWTYAFQIIENFRSPPSLCLSTHRTEWLQHYIENGYVSHDPHIKNTTTTSKPLFWRADSDWSSHGANTVQLMKDALSWGYWGGVCIPIYTKEGTRGFFAFACNKHDEETFSQAVHSAFLTRYFHHHLMRVWMKSHPEHISLHARLTRREIEIMVCVSEGLTSREIAERLHLSRRTVEGHVISVQEKLQAENRQQAVCKAINLGLLLPVVAASDDTIWIF